MELKQIQNLCSLVSSGGTPSRKHPEYYKTDGSGHLWVKSKELLDAAISYTEETISDEGLKQSSAKYYPANTASVNGSAITAYVIDDDRAVFQVQSAGTVTQAALGANVYLNAVQSTSTGSTTTGNSNTAVVAGSSAATTSGYAFRVVGFANVPGFSTVGDAYTDILVKFNPGAHSYFCRL